MGSLLNHHEVDPGVYGSRKRHKATPKRKGSPPGVYGSRRQHMAKPTANMLPVVYVPRVQTNRHQKEHHEG